MEKERIRGNHFDNIAPHPKYIGLIGGVERWRAIQSYMDQAEATLLPCPHCGGDAILNSGWAYISPDVRLTCTGCGCGTGRIGAGSMMHGGTVETMEDAIDLLVARWNARTEATA